MIKIKYFVLTAAAALVVAACDRKCTVEQCKRR